MAHFVFRSWMGVYTPLAILVLSSLMAVVQLWPNDTAAPIERPPASGQDGPDTSSFIQSAKPHVNIVGEPGLSGEPHTRQSSSQVSSTKSSATPSSGVSLLMDSARVHFATQAAALQNAMVSSSTKLFGEAKRLTSTTTLQTWSVIFIVILFVLLTCLICSVLSLAFRGKRRNGGSEGQEPLTGATPGFSHQVLSPAWASRSDPFSTNRQSPQIAAAGHKSPDDNTFGLRPWSPLPTSTVPLSHGSLEPQLVPETGPGAQLAIPNNDMPPPLCPTVVLPDCEVRVGIPLHELGKVQDEGELTIVGLSGSPLLRASLRKCEGGRTLEIAMPAKQSHPRAVVGPTFHDVVRPNGQKVRALQVFGMKGALYGMLEMRSSGACAIIRDGQTVLSIDGNSESLQLSVRTGNGLPLAEVTCSSDFGNQEHLELRVEAGVDTVLVLACVLAIVLLSPYPPSS